MVSLIQSVGWRKCEALESKSFKSTFFVLFAWYTPISTIDFCVRHMHKTVFRGENNYKKTLTSQISFFLQP